MPTPRKPTEVLELSGAFRKDPQRRRPVGPKHESGLGDPPSYLSEAERICWGEIVDNSPPGVLTQGERWIVEIAVMLMAKKRTVGLTAAEIAQLVKTMCLLGLTAVDRSRVVVEKDDKPSEFAEFLQ